ncbi:MAG: hypothetical protein WCD86_16715 [Ktedonobacteraceae bacterium]
MHSSFRLDTNHDLIVSPWGLPVKRRKLPFNIAVSLFAITAGWWMLTAGKESATVDWAIILFGGLGLVVFLLQLRWQTLLVMSEQEIRVHTNPFLRPLTLQWSEIAAITLFEGKRNVYLGLALSPDALTLFLLRQPFLTRKLIERRMRRFHQVALLSQRFLPNSLRKAYASIQQRYQPQIAQYHIICENSNAFWETFK